MEWQQALSRPENIPPGISPDAVTGFLRYLASTSHLQEIYFLWQPVLKDPNDDMVLEGTIGDFSGVEKFGIEAMPPAAFLRRLQGES